MNLLRIILLGIVIVNFARAQETTENREPMKAEVTSVTESASGESKPVKPAPKRRKKEIPPVSISLPAENETSVSNDELDNVFQDLEYPELQVVPRASDRLGYEAQNETDHWYSMHWPIQVSALSTIALASAAAGEYRDGLSEGEKDDHDTAVTTATGIGVFWLGTTIFYNLNRPYVAGYNRIKRLKVTDKRSELLRERIAEESMESPAKYMSALAKLSIATNIFAAAYISGNGDALTQRLAFVSALLSLTPWVFEHRYVEVWNKHIEYKRKIYTPLTSVNLIPDPKNLGFYPEVSLRWEF